MSDNKDKPNLIYIFADQLGYSRCGFTGDKTARTSNIDNFSKEGVNFTNAVSTMPVCAPYRASLFTGKYPTTTGMVINELRMNPNQKCFGHILTESNYNTAYIGKWHLYANELGNHYDSKNSFVPPGPHRLGFDGYWAAYNFNHLYYHGFYHRNTPRQIRYEKGVYEPDAQTNLAMEYLEGAAISGKPFALFLSYGTPHDPWTRSNVPQEYRKIFKDIGFPNPPNYEPENDKYADPWGRLSNNERKKLEKWRKYYYAMTANLDWNFGRLIEQIDKLSLSKNTIVVFTSDHGEMLGSHGRRAKNIFYEEAIRVPLLFRWPGKIPKNLTSDACVGTVDIMPTLLSLMGLENPKDAEGVDLSHCALGLEGVEPEFAFLQNTGACADWINGHEWRGFRDKKYTYAVFRVDNSEILFDNIKDPYQKTNLAENSEYSELIKKCRNKLKIKMYSINDTFEKCTWYRDNWTKNRIILRGARD
ncbi:MAG: sulfatase-like hydrolase/transferase [Candidatus Lokiarchaeota archaeon]|nr:sulfatase-like hydrolase/transferase [Candidatus Lokiarchaeota archaeon]MBD3337663.1 sulfatase-like hydrolase/transferase [Candidatus Lokiarchaeota archaeon]